MSTDVLQPPLKGMKSIPQYYGTDQWEILLGGFWVSLCNHMIQQPEARAAFKADTGLNLESLIHRHPFEALIDASTGYQNHMMAAWCDWVTEKHWGCTERKESEGV